MYINQKQPIADFIEMLKSGKALPTGSPSVYRLNDEIKNQLLTAPAEGEIIAIGGTVNGGHWKQDNGTGSGYIGNFQCRVRVGNLTTFANLSVADVVTAMTNGGKTTFTVEKSENAKNPDKPYFNLRCTNPVVVDIQDTKVITALDEIAKMAVEKPLSVTAG